jgi:acetyltransferase-like isoleucine patch superfamily enzyme
VIGDDVTIALDAIVLGPVTIGDGAFVAAQAMVLRDVPARSVVRGSPAAVVRMLDEPTVADDPRAGA